PTALVVSRFLTASSIDADVVWDEPIPADPAIVGLSLVFQAAAVVPTSGGVRVRFTNFLTEEIRA
ncbi:MAG: hypothetical protein KDB80_18445, partial [Planctomycetes bacterium]|nr:hypothetical protein [Planctomycetota bacterium]